MWAIVYLRILYRGLKLLKQHKSAENVMTDNEPKCQPKEEPVRPEVNYTQGMYCEIVIPEPGLGNGHPTTVVPMRRSMCKCAPCHVCEYCIHVDIYGLVH